MLASEFSPYIEALADLFYPQWCVGCSRRTNDVLCARCFEALPQIEGPICKRCGKPNIFEMPVCEECKGLDFGFESARAPCGTRGWERRSCMLSSIVVLRKS